MKPKLSIIIVHYNKKALLFNCLKSLKKHPPAFSHEIIVVDNDPKPKIKAELKQRFPHVKYLQTSTNIGYGAAINIGAQTAIGSYYFVVNPDILILKNSINPLVNFLNRHAKAAAVGPVLLNKKSKVYPVQGTSLLTPLKAIFSLSFINKLWPGNPISQSYWNHISNQTKPIPVDVIPGSAFLIRASIFKKIKGFDPLFFLYFEEADLFKRIRQLNYDLYLLPSSTLIHLWAKSISQTKLQSHFNFSRFYYFKKHFGLAKALIVEFFCRLNLQNTFLPLIILLAIKLRFDSLYQNMAFIGDQGHDYLAARDMVLSGHWPLVGIPSSVPWLHQGVFFTWLTALALKLGRFNPISPVFITAAFSLLTLVLIYYIAQKWFSRRAALLASFIAAVSPLMLAHSRMPYHISPIPFFSLIFLISLYFWCLNTLTLFWPVFFYSLLLQFELTALPLIILLPIFNYHLKLKTRRPSIVWAFIGLLIPFLPKIIYDFTHQFKQTFGLIAWSGYRILSLLGLDQRHPLTFNSFHQVLKTIFLYWQKFTTWDRPWLSVLIALLLTAMLLKRIFVKTKLELSLKILLSFLLVNFLAFIIHTSPSEAYFPQLFPVWVLLLAWFTDCFKKPIVSFLLTLVFIFNLFHLYQNRFYVSGPGLVERIQLVRLIRQTADSKPIKLINYPFKTSFPSDLDNYRYLMWWLNYPEASQSSQIYSVYNDDPDLFIQPKGTTVYYLPSSLLIKYD